MKLASSWIVYTEVVLALLPGLASAYVDPFIFEAFNGARPNLPLQTPAPTKVPRYQREEYRTLTFEDLEIRQDAQTTDELVLTITYAQGSTCGYVSESSNSPVVCSNGGTCYWEVLSVGAVACASGPNGEAGSLYTSCIEGGNENCDADCQDNIYNMLCTHASAPYCRTYTFPEGVVDFECISTSDSEKIAMDSTYYGEANAFFGTTVISDSASNGVSVPTSFTGTMGTVTKTATPTPSPKPKPKSSTPVGAIVGGVVGGLAVIVILVLGIFFMRRRNNKKNNGGDGGTIVAPVDPSQPPPQQQQQQWQQPVSQIYQPQSPPPAAAFYKGEEPDRNMTYSPGSTTLSGMPSPGGTVSYMSPSSPDPHHSVVYEMEDSAAPTHRELPA